MKCQGVCQGIGSYACSLRCPFHFRLRTSFELILNTILMSDGAWATDLSPHIKRGLLSTQFSFNIAIAWWFFTLSKKRATKKRNIYLQRQNTTFLSSFLHHCQVVEKLACQQYSAAVRWLQYNTRVVERSFPHSVRIPTMLFKWKPGCDYLLVIIRSTQENSSCLIGFSTITTAPDF